MFVLPCPPDKVRATILLPARHFEKVRGILLPGSLGGRWNPLLLPGGVRPRFSFVTSDR